MPAGEYLKAADRAALDLTIRRAEQLCRAEFSVFVGRAQGAPRPFAVGLHRSLVAPDRSILVMVDPVARAVEVVTGSDVRRHLDDNGVELAVASMVGLFRDDDLVGGLRRGIQQLAEHAKPANTLHSSL
ncbi:DUF5130 family protein [Nocardioides plantarum]|uniref:DUF5130 family protein n=1 Tax=Nocardioides plantarum TaxID=29299 RepID=A0ABV5KC45_9ACTN|nr:DUF5130 family protein [Nocardioides plantarum]